MEFTVVDANLEYQAIFHVSLNAETLEISKLRTFI